MHFETTLNTPSNKPINVFITNCTFDTNYAPEYYEFVPKLKPVLEDWKPYGFGGTIGLIFVNRVHEK